MNKKNSATNRKNHKLSEEELKHLAKTAWEYREKAYILGDTKVGAALMSDDGNIFGGCNVEHKYRCHDIHAEVNAISTMVSEGITGFRAIIIAAERKFFTPCGSCMDWIFQFGGPDCLVGYQAERGGEIKIFSAGELMPYYPE